MRNNSFEADTSWMKCFHDIQMNLFLTQSFHFIPFPISWKIEFSYLESETETIHWIRSKILFKIRRNPNIFRPYHHKVSSVALWFKAYQDDFLNISSFAVFSVSIRASFVEEKKLSIYHFACCLVVQFIEMYFWGSLDYAAHLIWIFILAIESINFAASSCLLSLSFYWFNKKSLDWICKRALSPGNFFCSSEGDAKEIENN